MKEKEILNRLKEQESLVDKNNETIVVNGKERQINRDKKGRFAPLPYKTSNSYRYRPMGFPYSALTQENKPKNRKPFS